MNISPIRMLILKLTLASFLLAFPRTLWAQYSLADSVHYWLDKSREEKIIDTVPFEKGIQLLGKLPLSDSLISVFETKARGFTGGLENYWRYRILLTILSNLSAQDMERAIPFGKRIYAETENLLGPHARYIRSAFLKQLRLPFRNSTHIREGFDFFTEKLKQFRETGDTIGMADCYYVLAGFYRTIGLIDQAIYNSKKSRLYLDSSINTKRDFGKFVAPNDRYWWVNNGMITGLYYQQKEDYEAAMPYFRKTLRIFLGGENGAGFSNAAALIAEAKLKQGKTDSVLYFLDMTFKSVRDGSFGADFEVFPLQILSEYYTRLGKTPVADSVLDRCDRLIRENQLPVNAPSGILAPDYYRALARIRENRIPEAIGLLKKDIQRLNINRLYVLRDLRLMASLYGQLGQNAEEAATYQQFITLQDSLFAEQGRVRSLSFEAEQEMDARELSITRLQSANKISTITRNFTIGFAILLLLLAAGLYQRFRFKHKANKELESALSNLKATQAQLVQSEKMASLGELTAGIAHEIQNPLNFVNNFSELNKELGEELKEELAKGNWQSARELADTIIDNQEKITHHGKRADGIVKGMLQHSRSGNGQKEPTDLNALCDEYLRLAYHGLRARDKSFNAKFETDLDPSIGSVSVQPQEMGRVILNLINNAFYAVSKRKEKEDAGYEPAVTVSTRKVNNNLEIQIRDNGTGIPPAMVEKIFQPFFTTKPTGDGTGLGLSLSYDIITKGHGGTIKVETREGHGSSFNITLPLN